MPAKKRKRSALKRIRQTQRRTNVRTIGRSAARTAVRAAREAIAKGGDVLAKGGEAAQDVIAAAASALDRAAKRGSIHKNSARRRKSRIAKAAAKSRKRAS
jgi:small subunit ribosomal protein S20